MIVAIQHLDLEFFFICTAVIMVKLHLFQEFIVDSLLKVRSTCVVEKAPMYICVYVC